MSRFIISSMAASSTETPTVERNGEWARIGFGYNVHISLHMEALRDLCNDIAEVLDEWFEEADRLGASHE